MPAQIDATMARLQAAAASLERAPRGRTRARSLRRAADALEARLAEFCGLLVKEAHKTLGRLRRRGARGGRLPALLRRRGRAAPGTAGSARPDRREQRAAPARPRRVRLHQPVELPARDLRRPGGGGARRRQRGGRQAGRADAGRRRSAWSRCCTRPACRPTRSRCCTARARRWAPRSSPTHARPACASPARRRWRRSSTARLPPRTARSCR